MGFVLLFQPFQLYHKSFKSTLSSLTAQPFPGWISVSGQDTKRRALEKDGFVL